MSPLFFQRLKGGGESDETKRYTAEEKAWVQQLAPPLSRTVVEMAKETVITTVPLPAWRNEANDAGVVIPETGKRNGRWSSADKFRTVLETMAMSEVEIAEYCRAKGIQPGDLVLWRHACQRADRGDSDYRYHCSRADQGVAA